DSCKFNGIPLVDDGIGFGAHDGHSERGAHVCVWIGQKERFVGADYQWSFWESLLQRLVSTDMIGVPMGIENCRYTKLVGFEKVEDQIGFQSRIQNNGLVAPSNPHDVGVFFEGLRNDGLNLQMW